MLVRLKSEEEGWLLRCAGFYIVSNHIKHTKYDNKKISPMNLFPPLVSLYLTKKEWPRLL